MNVLQTLYILRELFTVKNLLAVSCLMEQENVKNAPIYLVLYDKCNSSTSGFPNLSFV